MHVSDVRIFISSACMQRYVQFSSQHAQKIKHKLASSIQYYKITLRVHALQVMVCLTITLSDGKLHPAVVDPCGTRGGMSIHSTCD